MVLTNFHGLANLEKYNLRKLTSVSSVLNDCTSGANVKRDSHRGRLPTFNK